MITTQLVGRRSSLFTRVPLIVAHELGVPVELTVIHDLTDRDPAAYGGNPALKLPTLRRPSGDLVFGAEHICRVLAADTTLAIVWPEQLRTDVARNAHEMVAHAAAAQIQLIMGTIIGKLPADSTYFAKGRAGMEGALGWLEAHVEPALAALPPRAFSLLEVMLFCLIEHVAFRPTVSLEPYPALVQFARAWGERASARDTAYRYDPRPA